MLITTLVSTLQRIILTVYSYCPNFYNLILYSILIALWLYSLWSQRHLYRFAWKFPGEFGLPYIGIFIYIRGTHNVIPYLTKLYEKYKTYTLHVWLGIRPTLVTSDPDFIKLILSSPKLLNKMTIYSVFDDIFGTGLLSSPASEWQIHRKKINPSFNHQVLLSFFPIFNTAKNTAVNKLELMADDNKLYGITELFLKISMEISFETVMGKSLKDNNKIDRTLVQHFITIVHKSTVKGVLTFVKLDFIFDLYIKYVLACKAYTKCVLELLREKITKENVQEDSADQKNDNNNQIECIQKKPQIFVDQVLKIYKREDFTLQEVIGETNQVLTASFETTAVNMIFTLVLLAMHPIVQERLYEELLIVFPDKEFCMKQEDMDQLPYLEMVIKEGMRLFPPIGFIGRRVMEDTQISDDICLPKDLEIGISIYHLHRRPDIWGPNADKFDPDNFLPENERDRHKFAYIPFSGGLRNCIGWRYALFLAKIMIAGVIRNYRIETDTKLDEIELDLNVTLKFKEEPRIRAYRRPHRDIRKFQLKE